MHCKKTAPLKSNVQKPYWTLVTWLLRIESKTSSKTEDKINFIILHCKHGWRRHSVPDFFSSLIKKEENSFIGMVKLVLDQNNHLLNPLWKPHTNLNHVLQILKSVKSRK